MERGSTKREIEAKKAEAIKLLKMSPMDRFGENLPMTQQEIAEHCNLSPSVITDLKRTIDFPDAINPVSDFKGMTDDERKSAVLDSLLQMVVTGRNSNAAKLLLQFWGLLIEKSEVTHKISGADIAGAFLRAGRELRDADYRVGEVSDEPGILPEELRISPGQSAGEDT